MKRWGENFFSGTRASIFRLCALIGLALAISGPFLSSRGIGVDEALNYSLAVADGVTQMRQGIFPVLVGQSEFAFNGRVHPLRTAPGLIYAAGFLDVVTGRQLGFWALQNGVIALSLFAGVGALDFALRRVARVGSLLAWILTAAYALGPGLLSQVYTADLYMTVVAAPFAILALAANLRALLEPTFERPWLLALSLGALWTFHPPIAAWITLLTVEFQIVVLLLSSQRWASFRTMSFTALVASVLVVFPFVSVQSVQKISGLNQNLVPAMMWQLKESLPASVLPANDQAYEIGNYQLGYFLWIGWALSFGRWFWARRKGAPALWRKEIAALLFLGTAGLLLLLLMPVPGLTEHLWHALPSSLVTITNVWPMQRLYLISSMLVVTGGGLVWTYSPLGKTARSFGVAGLVAGLAWSAWQAKFYVGDRGFGTRKSPEESRRVHRPDNLDLTATAYAFLGQPDTYFDGVMDPRFEVRLLRDGKEEISGNWEAARAKPNSIVAEGPLTVSEVIDVRRLVLTPRFVLNPGKHYLFAFVGETPADATFLLSGEDYFRRYNFTSPSGPRGFGVLPGNRRDLALYTAGDQPLFLEVRVDFPAEHPHWKLNDVFSHFTLREVDLAELPLRLQSLLPLRYEIDCRSEGCYLETVRRFIPGYAAIVNGRLQPVLRSPQGNAMVPVPAGRSLIELTYPGPPVVRIAFWISFSAWTVVGIGLAGHAISVAWRRRRNFVSARARQ